MITFISAEPLNQIIIVIGVKTGFSTMIDMMLLVIPLSSRQLKKTMLSARTYIQLVRAASV